MLAAGAIATTLTGAVAYPQTASAQTWTGVYMGANGGYAWAGNTTTSFTPNDPAADLHLVRFGLNYNFGGCIGGC